MLTLEAKILFFAIAAMGVFGIYSIVFVEHYSSKSELVSYVEAHGSGDISQATEGEVGVWLVQHPEVQAEVKRLCVGDPASRTALDMRVCSAEAANRFFTFEHQPDTGRKVWSIR